MLECGQMLISLARQFSFWLLRIDGVDQAKFRVPRLTQKTHAFDKLIRPALHVQGAWCEGFGFHFAVADADMKKDTNNNIEVLARLMEQLYCTWDALPLSIAIIQDNTARECTNQEIVMWAVRLVAMGVFESIVLCYPQKGHTHGPLDGVFGQMCVKLSLAEFEDDMDVVNILDNFLKSSGLDTGSREGAQAYKLDQAPEWIEWAETVDLTMSNLTGPEAPHYFRVCLRGQLGYPGPHGDLAPEIHACNMVDHRGYLPRAEDVVMLVKDRMASTKVSQIVLMIPKAARPALWSIDAQPTGNHSRRPASDSDRKKIRDEALRALQVGAISPKACDYLSQWAQGTRRRQPGPLQYRFLAHRPHPLPVTNLIAHVQAGPIHAPRPAHVASTGDHGALPLGEEQDGDVEPGPLIISEHRPVLNDCMITVLLGLWYLAPSRTKPLCSPLAIHIALISPGAGPNRLLPS